MSLLFVLYPRQTPATWIGNVQLHGGSTGFIYTHLPPPPLPPVHLPPILSQLFEYTSFVLYRYHSLDHYECCAAFTRKFFTRTPDRVRNVSGAAIAAGTGTRHTRELHDAELEVDHFFNCEGGSLT